VDIGVALQRKETQMLVLSRKPGESIVIDGRIVVKVLDIGRGRVQVGIEAPREVPVERSELRRHQRAVSAEVGQAEDGLTLVSSR